MPREPAPPPAPPAPDDGDAAGPEGRAPARPADPPRLIALLGLLAALLVAATPFAAWLRVSPAAAERVGAAVAAAATEARGVPGSDLLGDLAARLAAEAELTGLDLVQWARGARARLAADAPSVRTERLVRSWGLAAGLVLGTALAGAVLALYLGAHALGRWRAPLQVLGLCTGVLAAGVAGLLETLAALAPGTLQPGPGQRLLLVGGLGLLGAVAGALAARSALRVLGGALLVLLSLVGLAWAWIEQAGL